MLSRLRIYHPLFKGIFSSSREVLPYLPKRFFKSQDSIKEKKLRSFDHSYLHDTYLIPRKLELTVSSKEIENIARKMKITDKEYYDSSVSYKGYNEGKSIVLTSKHKDEPGQKQKIIDEVFYNPTEVRDHLFS